MQDNQTPAKPRNTAASWALGLGIVAILASGGDHIVGGLILIPGVITGIVGLNNARRLNGAGQTRAIIGLALTTITIAITVARVHAALSAA